MTPRSLFLLMVVPALFLTSCASTAHRGEDSSPMARAGENLPDGKSVQEEDDLDEYSVASVADPLEPVNRVTFWVNHQVYRYLLRPVATGYEFVVPDPVRTGIYNVFENVKYPVRVVNDVLQGNLPRAGQETGKFIVNTTLGIGGLMTPSDKFPALADVPEADTGQTFGKWGIGHGIYLVLPLLGPSSLRDTVGLAGDYALNPVTYVGFLYGGFVWDTGLDWTVAIPAVYTVRNLPKYMDTYEAATDDALDRYLAARSAYIQYRAELLLK